MEVLYKPEVDLSSAGVGHVAAMMSCLFYFQFTASELDCSDYMQTLS